jgi:hypothetical protein
MTKDIIEHHLLISGSEIRPEIRLLERSAKIRGFTVERTGQFGIGVLSYFMISDRMEITARRSAEGGDRDGTGWKFMTEGIGDFGELARTSRQINGTEVKLRLLKGQLGNEAGHWFERLREYVRQTIRWLPCRLEIRDDISKQTTWRSGPGWTYDASDMREILVRMSVLGRREDEEGTDGSVISSKTREVMALKRSSMKVIRDKFGINVKLHGPKEFSLPNNVGMGRIWFPYFEFNDEVSLSYVELDQNLYPFLRNISLFKTLDIVSWKGFFAPKVGSDQDQDSAIRLRHTSDTAEAFSRLWYSRN